MKVNIKGNNKGEIASLLTVFSMMVIGLGLVIGYNLSQSNQPVNTQTEAQTPPTTAPLPTAVPGDSVLAAEDEAIPGFDFDTKNAVCQAQLVYRRDPIIKKVQIRDSVSGRMFTIDQATENIPGKGDGKFTQGYAFDEGSGVIVTWGLPDHKDEIFLDVDNGKKSPKQHYYAKPSWLGQNTVDVVFYYDRILGPRNNPTEIQHAKQKTTAPGGCIPPSVTPSLTPSLTPSITPSVTPSPTATPVPQIFSCFEPDSLDNPGCRSTSQCEPTNAAGEKLECFEVSLKGGSRLPVTPIDPRLPRRDQKDSTGSTTDGTQDTSGLNVPTATGSCDAGEICRCLPKRCLNSDCTTYPKACLNQTPTPTQAPVSCTYKALAFIEECTKLNSDGTCATDTSGRFVAKPIDDKDLSLQWSPLNEKMRDNSAKQDRYFTNKGQTKNKSGDEVLKDTDEIKFHNLTSSVSERASIENPLEGGFRFFNNTGMLNSGLTYSMFSDSQALPAGSNPLTADAEIKHGLKNDPLRYPEVYNNKNKTSAEVKFYFDKEQYRVVPGGNKVYSCLNDLKNIKDGKGACVNPDVQPEPIATRDRVQGLTVGCGQEIVYGVTLQKCDFNYDYVFLVDTSNSMTDPKDDDRNEEGPNKLTAVAKQLESYVNDIKTSTPKSRVAVTYFNTGIGFDVNTTNQVLLDFTSVQDGQAQILNTVKYDSLFKVGHEGTCIRCGFETTKKLIDRRTDTSRRPVVILLSDGNVNEFPGQTQDIDEQTKQTKNAAITLWNGGKTTLVAIGYGNGGINASPTDRVNWKGIINEVASLRKDEKTRWAYATAPEVSPDGVGRSLNQVIKEIQQDLNSCAVADLAYKEFIKASDINKDGVINSLDLLMLYDNYSKRGENIPEDVNKDRIVNALDSSLVIQNYGKIVETTVATGGLTNPVDLDTTPAN